MLNVPLFPQEPRSNWCGLYCLKMVYAHYGIDRDVPAIASAIELLATGAYAQELGYDLLQQGFAVTLVTRDTSRLPFNYLWLSAEEKIEDLERRLEALPNGAKQSVYLRGMARFLRSGGDLAVDFPFLERFVKPALAAGRPVIACIDAKALYAEEWARPESGHARDHVGPTGHYVVIVGLDAQEVTINDPSAWHGGVHRYPLDRFLYALYSFQGYLLLPRRDAVTAQR